MLAVTDTIINDEDNIAITHFACDEQVTLAGDSCWDCTITSADDVRIKDIYINEGLGDDNDDYVHMWVYYTVNGDAEFADSWRIYSDTGFKDTVSKLLGFEVFFTEQGMQQDGAASMEF
jgi:hypothetical protein